jgi:cysteine desulfurase / selenocysteine lyase
MDRAHRRVARLIRPQGGRLTAEQLAAELSPLTRLFCRSWVFSFTGHTIDLATIGSVCRERDVWFVVNGSQGVGSAHFRCATRRSTP